MESHDGKQSQLFVFDRVLDPNSSQQDVFEEVLPIVQVGWGTIVRIFAHIRVHPFFSLKL